LSTREPRAGHNSQGFVPPFYKSAELSKIFWMSLSLLLKACTNSVRLHSVAGEGADDSLWYHRPQGAPSARDRCHPNVSKQSRLLQELMSISAADAAPFAVTLPINRDVFFTYNWFHKSAGDVETISAQTLCIVLQVRSITTLCSSLRLLSSVQPLGILVHAMP
jgi:hypothetical protein